MPWTQITNLRGPEGPPGADASDGLTQDTADERYAPRHVIAATQEDLPDPSTVPEGTLGLVLE